MDRWDAVYAILEMKEIERKVREKIEPWLAKRGKKMPKFRNLAQATEFYANLSLAVLVCGVIKYGRTGSGVLDHLFDPIEAGNMREKLWRIFWTLSDFARVKCDDKPCYETFQKLASLAIDLRTVLHLLSP